jgi:tetratricopeptide (TPR) repeat protein
MKAKSKKLFTIFILSLMIYSCGPSLSPGVRNHLNIAYRAEYNGSWGTAEAYYGKALVQAESEETSEYVLAILNYQYGRALGVTCSFAEAEQHLLKALELDEKNNGETFKDLTELARLHYDQGHYPEAISYFEKSIPILDQMDSADEAPIAYSDILLEYSEALQQTGKTVKAEDLKNRALEIRNKHSEKQSITERTPYGKYCA